MSIEKQEQNYSKTQWIIGIVIIPLAFTVILGAIIWGVVAGDFSEKAMKIGNSIPIVKSFVPDVESEETDLNQNDNENKNLSGEIDKLKDQIEQKNNEIQDLQVLVNEKNLLIAEYEGKEQSNEENRVSKEERMKQMSDIADLYASMSASKAAPIVSSLTLKESSIILSFMDEEARAELLSKMDPQRAADISILLKNQTLSDNDEIAALQERIQLLTEQISSLEENPPTESDIVSTYNTMQPDRAAEILTELYSIDRAGTISILSSVEPNQRSLILASMDASIAAAITRSIHNN